MQRLHLNFRHILLSLAITTFLLSPFLVFTQKTFAATGINRQINFQGRLVNNTTGLNVSNGSYSVVFTLYNNPNAGQGTALWTETQNVTTTDGIFRVALGSVTAIPANFNFNWDGLYLGIKVGTDTEMTPRIQMASVPFAFNSQQVAGLTVQDSTSGAASTSATLKIGTSGGPGVTPITVDLGLNSLTFNTGSVGSGSLILRSSGATDVTFPTGVTGTVAMTTLQSDITGNSKNITALAGLTVNGGGLISSATSGTLGIGTTANTTSLTFGNSSATSLTLNVGTSGNFVLQKNGAGLSCAGNANGGKLTTDASGNVSCQDDTSGSGGGTNYFGQTSTGLTYIGNTTTDFAIGGNSTASAKFIFGGVNNPANGGIAIATFSGQLMMNAQPNSSNFDQTNWQKISGTTGTLGGGTGSIASISAMATFNGSLYVGTTNIANGAEVYRYNGGTNWTRVNFAAGQIISGDTSGIASISAMTVFNGNLYIGTSKINGAEVYRYNGNSTWYKASGPTAGTFSGSTGLDGVTSLVVFQGALYAGIREPGAGRLLEYTGGINWISINNNTTGTFVTTNTVGAHSVGPMVVKNGVLYLAVQKESDTDLVEYSGGTGTGASTTFIALNAQGATGSYSVNGAAIGPVAEITAMTVYNGAVILAVRVGNNGADILQLQDGSGVSTSNINVFTRLNNAVGQMTNTGTSSIDSVTSLTVYNGFLYAGTNEPGKAEIYKYVGGDAKWVLVSQTGGTGQIASGGTTGIYGISMMAPLNGDLYAGTNLGLKAEVYKLANVNEDKSYSIVFRATPDMAGGEQSGLANTASIFYLASASANLGNSAANSGAFIFDHGIQTRNGSYDVAEDYPTRDDTLQPGDLVSIDPNETGFVQKTTQAYDSMVLGVYSTNPALRLSQQDSTIDGGNTIPVALAGRAPVKVSTESGVIKPGDYLTPSSTPGVAMKATRSGGVVGQAMEGYAGDGVGKILVYIKSMSYEGSIADNFANLDTNAPDFAVNVLSSLNAQTGNAGKSNIVTDRLIAGLGIITPSITTTNLTADTITARTIKADTIEGLEIYTNRLGSLADAVASLQSLTGSQAAVLGAATGDATLAQTSAPLTPSQLTLASLSIDGLATISADLNVKGNGLIQGALNVLDSLTTKNLLVSQFAYFINDVVFKGNVRFNSPPTFNSDTAGFAVVKKGSDNVSVNFSQEYADTPVVTASITLDKLGDDVAQKQLEDAVLNGNLSFVLTQRTTKGFLVRLNKAAPEDINFSWIALSVKDAKTSGLDNSSSITPAATDSAAFQSIINQLNNFPSPPPPE
jgi:hypothetical protein